MKTRCVLLVVLCGVVAVSVLSHYHAVKEKSRWYGVDMDGTRVFKIALATCQYKRAYGIWPNSVQEIQCNPSNITFLKCGLREQWNYSDVIYWPYDCSKGFGVVATSNMIMREHEMWPRLIKFGDDGVCVISGEWKETVVWRKE